MISPAGGPLRLDRKPPSRGSWFHCGCATNSSHPQVLDSTARAASARHTRDFVSRIAQSCFADGWQDAFLEQAQQLVPFVENGTVVGIFFGDEVDAAALSAGGRRLTTRCRSAAPAMCRSLCSTKPPPSFEELCPRRLGPHRETKYFMPQMSVSGALLRNT